MTEPTDEAIRAEAERRYPAQLPYNAAFERAMTNRAAFEAGVQWAREQPAPTVAPDVETLHRVLYDASGDVVMPHLERARMVSAQARAAAAADPRRTEQDVKNRAFRDGYRAGYADRRLEHDYDPDTRVWEYAYYGGDSERLADRIERETDR